MKYAIVQVDIAGRYGVTPENHNCNNNQRLMVVNENELRRIDSDIAKAATLLGGELLSLSECTEQCKSWNDYE